MPEAHVVAHQIMYGGRTVQRCAWCGTKVVDRYETDQTPVAVGIVPPTYPFFPPGDVVLVHDDGAVEWLQGADMASCLAEEP